ncbi:HTH-type transcriptional activator IlvY [Oceanicoccus sp. KOV_DT_Chl]|uniref:HTH-type transcriptional activator IlvY n=1 Tax=Oceanicoccus sp. KOV_DT_Chl TaxID=1904639 RepID=UPI000C7A51D7|nr:HTH-type transcriptional activator IlvY [Oceanicoccus sp. KOV_DT_Chl]
MDTKDLQLFLNLSETLHFGQTGEAMHLSASAVSRTIRRMEDEVGQRLLERDNRTVRLTEIGRQFQGYARQALGQWQSFHQSVKRETEGLKGEISVFCSVTATYSVLLGVLESFRLRYPDIEIKLRTGDQADAIGHLLAGDDDIAIAARPDKLSSRLQFQTLTHSPLQFIYPRMHCAVESQLRRYLDANSPIPWQAIPFIVSERGLARTRLDHWFRGRGIKPDIYAQVSGHEAIVSMVGLGFGVGVVPELVLANSPLKDKVEVIDVQPPLTPFAIGLAASAQRLENPLVKAFWDCAKASYRN